MGGAIKRGTRWYVRWRNAAGVLQRQVTSAKTEREALSLLAELEGQASRVKLGLEAAPIKIRATLEQLCMWWLADRCPEPSKKNEWLRLRKHVFAHELGRLPLQLVTADAIETRLQQMEKGDPVKKVRASSPGSLNRLRTTLHSVFTAASEPPRRWQGENPVEATRIRDVEKVEPPTLSPEQIPLMLAKAPASWRGTFATAAYLGLRKGEIFALRKNDYDRGAQQLRVAASHQRATTKGGRFDILPVPAILKPYLEQALKSRSIWLFPGRFDQQRGRESDPHLIVRTACVAAGIVDHWERWCRRCKGEGRPTLHVRVTGAKPEPSSCSTCGMKLWVRGSPPLSRAGKPIRFHDLRHGLATNLLRAGVPLAHVQRILRHASITTTVNIYGHMVTEDLRLSLEAVTGASSGRGMGRGPDPPLSASASHGVRSAQTQIVPKPRSTEEE